MLHTGHQVGTIEAAEVVVPEEKAEASAMTSTAGSISNHLSLLQQQQLERLLEQYWDIFIILMMILVKSLFSNILLRQGPPVRLPYF